MGKKIGYLLIVLAVIFFLAFPLVPIGGNYYRGLLIVWHYQRVPDSGFIKLLPDYDWYSIVWFADPTSFRSLDEFYGVDRFSVYIRGDRIPDSDGSTFRSVGNGCYVDSVNARCGGFLILKQNDLQDLPEPFHTPSFQSKILVRYVQHGRDGELRRDDNFQAASIYFKDQGGFYMQTQYGGSVEKRGSGEWNVPVVQKINIVDTDSFEVWSISSCDWDTKEGKCVYVDKCFVRDKDFNYEAEPPNCKMTGAKTKR